MARMRFTWRDAVYMLYQLPLVLLGLAAATAIGVVGWVLVAGVILWFWTPQYRAVDRAMYERLYGRPKA